MGHLLRGEKKHPNNIFGFKTYPAYPWPFLYDVVLESNSNKPLWFIWATTGHLSMSGNLCIIWHYDSSKKTWSIEHLTWGEWSQSESLWWQEDDDPWSQARGHRADGQWPQARGPEYRARLWLWRGPRPGPGSPDSVSRHQPPAPHPEGHEAHD